MRPLAVLAVILAFSGAQADFVYLDFNDTTGIAFVGTAATTSCDNGTIYSWYQPRHGTMDGLDNGTIPDLQAMDTVHLLSQGQATDNITTSVDIASHRSTIGHRDTFGQSPDLNGTTCPLRMRITSSQPNKTGAFWRLDTVPLFSGFDTIFQFQITDLTRSCTQVKDRHFRTFHHESCMVHGGDGFAFVIHLDPNETSTIGAGGEDMGYGGIRNAIVVEFDTWYNPWQGDLFSDHVSVQLSGPKVGVTVGEHSRLASIKPHDLADGKMHIARITYYNFINYDYLQYFTGSTELNNYLKDAGEGKRIGTFVVFVDDMAVPLIAFPINLSVALKLPEGLAYVGFTASTGRSWEKHDIVSWVWCDLPGCPLTNVQHGGIQQPSPPLDYHQDDRLYFRRMLSHIQQKSPYRV